MSAAHYIVLLGDDALRVARVDAGHIRWSESPLEPDTHPPVLAQRITDALKIAGHRGERILLALPARMCLAARIDLSGLSPRDRAAMGFRLEEKLPIPAEEFVCDFVSDGSAALGVATPLNKLKELVDAMRAKGIVIGSISPRALLATKDDDHASDAILQIIEGDSVNLVAVHAGRPQHWLYVANHPADIAISLKLLALQFDQSLPVSDIEPAERVDERVALEGARILSGQNRPWIELARDGLAPGDRLTNYRAALNLLLTAATLLFLALGAAFYIRGQRYARAADESDAQLLADFQSVYPGWTTSNIPAVVESEHRKLAAATSAALPEELKGSALRTLHDVLARIPANASINIDRMTFDNAAFELEGKAGSLGDVDALASATRNAGITVQPPQSRRDDDGKWAFTIRGSRLSATATLPQENR